MAITYPTTLDTLNNPTGTDPVNSPSHATQHADANDAIEALEAKVGVNSSAVTTSHDYKLSGVTGSDKAVSLTGSEVLTNKTLTAPKIANGGFIADANGNEQVIFTTTASAVNEVAITNATTGTTGPLIAASGETNVDLRVSGKGTGKVHNISSTYGNITTYSPSVAGTATLTLNTSNIHTINMPAGNITIALSNESVGQCFIVNIVQDGGGSRTVTWFSTIKWAGGGAPTLTTTGGKIDSIGFIVTSAGNYQAYVVGQNI